MLSIRNSSDFIFCVRISTFIHFWWYFLCKNFHFYILYRGLWRSLVFRYSVTVELERALCWPQSDGYLSWGSLNTLHVYSFLMDFLRESVDIEFLFSWFDLSV
jgi:hypothetical protein